MPERVIASARRNSAPSPVSHFGMERLLSRFSGVRGPRYTALLAMLWSLPALGLGLQTDDHLMRWAVQAGSPMWQLYRLDPGFVASRRASGFFPWWTHPEYEIAFFRPLASLWHSLDFRFFPELPALMLAENVALYGGTVWVAARLYRRLLPAASSATLASLMFALDEAHAVSVGWIASRNTLLSGLFSLLALSFHVGVGGRPQRVLALLSLGLALLSGEAGLGALALLVAFEACADGPLAQRLRRLAAPFGLLGLWLGLYLAGGYGARGSGWYRTPREPLAALLEGLADLPLWLSGLLGPPGMSLAVMAPPQLARLLALPIALALLALVWPTVRDLRASRPFALAALLALLPLLLTMPSGRVAFLPTFGAFGVLALAATSRPEARMRERVTRRLLLMLHLGLAPLSFPFALRTTQALEAGVQVLARATPEDRQTVLVRSPFELLPSYALCLDSRCGAGSERSLQQLYAGGGELSITRPAANVLELTVPRGWAATPFERVYSGPPSYPSRAVARDLRADVLARTEDGRPLRVRFTFAHALESAAHTLLIWEGAEPVAFVPPAIGGRVWVAPLDLTRAFSR